MTDPQHRRFHSEVPCFVAFSTLAFPTMPCNVNGIVLWPFKCFPSHNALQCKLYVHGSEMSLCFHITACWCQEKRRFLMYLFFITMIQPLFLAPQRRLSFPWLVKSSSSPSEQIPLDAAPPTNQEYVLLDSFLWRNNWYIWKRKETSCQKHFGAYYSFNGVFRDIFSLKAIKKTNASILMIRL